MSDPQPAEAVKLIASLFSGDGCLIDDALRALSERYGRADFISAPTSFDYTDYYEKEFGGPLIRRFAAFEQLVRPESLADVKLWTNALERRLSAEGRRRVNIDPGYLARAHLILATGKGYTHRPYLRDGIYADLTLMYREKKFHPLPWTYPDYAGGEVTGMLTRIREKYILQLKGKAGSGDRPAGDPWFRGIIPSRGSVNDQKHDRLRPGRVRHHGQEIRDRDEVGQPPLSGDIPASARDASCHRAGDQETDRGAVQSGED